MQSTRHFLCF